MLIKKYYSMLGTGSEESYSTVFIYFNILTDENKIYLGILFAKLH